MWFPQPKPSGHWKQETSSMSQPVGMWCPGLSRVLCPGFPSLTQGPLPFPFPLSLSVINAAAGHGPGLETGRRFTLLHFHVLNIGLSFYPAKVFLYADSTSPNILFPPELYVIHNLLSMCSFTHFTQNQN